jgi:chromosomal replication initiation ATPase DnaA
MTDLIDRLIKRVRDLEAELLAVRRDFACKQTWTAREEAELERASPLVFKLAAAMGIDYIALVGPDRDAFTAKCRQFAYWYLRQEGFSLRSTAAALGRVSHETVCSGVRVVEDRLETDKKYVQWHQKVLADLNKT